MNTGCTTVTFDQTMVTSLTPWPGSSPYNRACTDLGKCWQKNLGFKT